MIRLRQHKKQNNVKNNREIQTSPDFYFYGDILNKSIKSRARKALKSKKRSVTAILFSFLSAAAGVFVIRMVISGANFAYAVWAGIALSAVYFVIKSCTNYRMQAQMILLLSNGEKPQIKPKEYLKNAALYICLFLLKAAEFAAFEFLPLSMVFLLYQSIKASAVSMAFCITVLIGAALLSAAGLVFFVFSVQKYAKAPFLLAAYPALTVKECIILSVENGEKKAADLLRFKLGFLLWLPACIAIFPLLYVVPYYKQSLTCWFKQGF